MHSHSFIAYIPSPLLSPHLLSLLLPSPIMDRPPGKCHGEEHGGVEGDGGGSSPVARTLTNVPDCCVMGSSLIVVPQAPMSSPASMGLPLEQQPSLMTNDGAPPGSHQGPAVAALELGAQPASMNGERLDYLPTPCGCQLAMRNKESLKDLQLGLQLKEATKLNQVSSLKGKRISGSDSLFDYAPSTITAVNGVNKARQEANMTNDANKTSTHVPMTSPSSSSNKPAYYQHQCSRSSGALMECGPKTSCSRLPSGISRPNGTMSIEDYVRMGLRNATSWFNHATDFVIINNKVSLLKTEGISGPDSSCDCVLSTKASGNRDVNMVGQERQRINDVCSLSQLVAKEISLQAYLNFRNVKDFIQSACHEGGIMSCKNLGTTTDVRNVTCSRFENATNYVENKVSVLKTKGIPVPDPLRECVPSTITAGNDCVNKAGHAVKSICANSFTQIFVKVCGKEVSMQENLNTTTVKELIESACHKSGILSCDMYAIHGGKPLKSEKFIACYPIFKDSIVYIRPRLRAGSRVPEIECETFDELLRRNPGKLFHRVRLSTLSTNSNKQSSSVTFLSRFIAYHIHQILIFICGRHREGKSFDGKFESKHILVLNKAMVVFDKSIQEVNFTPQSCGNDFAALHKIFGCGTFKDNGKYPLYFKHFLNYLFKCPAQGASNTEPLIQFLTNHPALASFTDRIKQCNLLDSMVHYLYSHDYASLDLKLGSFHKWLNDVKLAPALDKVFYYNAKFDPTRYVMKVNAEYTTSRLGCLHFARNYFNHADVQLSPEEAEAAFAETLEDFLPDLLLKIAKDYKAPAYFDILSVLGNPLADSFSGK